MQPPITSKRVQIALGILSVFILMCLSFLAGAKTSERRARHFQNWSNHYPEMMRPHRGDRAERGGRPGMMLMRPPMPMPNGVFGRVLSVTGTSMIIEGQDHFEQNVIVGTSTVIRTNQGNATTTDIQPNMEVGVFGAPNAQGQIEARLIRLSPSSR